MSQPLVTVIIPTYNREQYISEAIDSVLAQTYSNIELIIVDDGSTDNTIERLQTYGPKLRYIQQENGGIGAARNAGIAQATGEFLAFLDSDDCWTPDKLTLQIAAFDQDPDLDIAFGHVRQFYSPETDQQFRQRILCPEAAIPGYISGMMLLRRSTFLQVGGFTVAASMGTDIDWYSRAVEQNLRLKLLSNVIYWRRLHGTNGGLLKPQHSDRLRTLKSILDRRRASGKTTSHDA
jgi:glycosyltransferase involved in cell wall biosynthesis